MIDTLLRQLDRVRRKTGASLGRSRASFAATPHVPRRLLGGATVDAKAAELASLGPVTRLGGSADSRDPFACDEMRGRMLVRSRLETLDAGAILLMDAPHPFWSKLRGDAWAPDWRELYALCGETGGVSIVQYSPSPDPQGRYFFAVRRTPNDRRPLTAPEGELRARTFRVFYYAGGADLSQGRSNRVLSARLCHALEGAGSRVYSYAFDDLSGVDASDADDILIGHPGPWIRAASERGLRKLLLYTPANRWYPTRHSRIFEQNATFEEQVALAEMVIAQSGMVWRLSQRYPQPAKWRWIDIGIDRKLFPLLRDDVAAPGRRRFCFVNLYNDHEKGADIAREVARRMPATRFVAIGGVDPKLPNVEYHSHLENSSSAFRDALAGCDVLLAPSREDAQAATIAEAMALGIVPITTYTAGYSVGFPELSFGVAVGPWVRQAEKLQHLPSDALRRLKVQVREYVDAFHSWDMIESQIRHYVREYMARAPMTA